MKFFAVFATVLAVACAYQAQWTIPELSAAIQDPHTNPALLPYLHDALNEAMYEAITGSSQPVVAVTTPVQDLSSWTLHELSEAIQDPSTDSALIPYLMNALDTIMANLMAGGQQDTIIIATPVGLLPVQTEVAPVPVFETPVVVPAPVEVPIVAPVPVETPVAAPTSPLVQIIVNIKQQEEVAAPAPVAVEEVLPVPISVMPQPIITAPVPVNPVDVIAITPPEAIINPVDVIAITPPEVNPVDIMSPIPVVPAGASEVVGPIV